MRTRLPLLVLLVAAAGGASYYYARPPDALVVTGIVTTNDVAVAPQIGGRIARLLAADGDEVHEGQLLAVIAPDELQAERTYYEQSAAGLSAQVEQSQAALRYMERQTADQIRQAESTLAAAESSVVAAAADLEDAQMTYARLQDLAAQGVAPAQERDRARTAKDAAEARLASLRRQVEAQRAAVALARASAEQVAMRRSQVATSRHQQAAAAAQKTQADVRLAYTEVTAPIDGLVDTRAVREGEVVTPGQLLLTLIDPDDLWVRADIEESYIDRVKLGETLAVRLGSGAELQGTVFYRGADADFATQRNVSRTKRDIRTFEIRLRVDNRDRRLATGMTAYVQVPLR
ncbi:MAG: efflux RND transporter periplasmic adaptor subunit [Acidobacteria bacterium]|nr:efflux RND transporter periplasmic adaptor subunit [Acidobacteriota bacterium]